MKKDDFKELKQASKILKAVAHPVRLEIVQVLRKTPHLSVGDIQSALGITQSMTSQHLAALKNVDIVVSEKEGNVCYYSIRNRDVLRLLDCVRQCACVV